MLFFKVAKRPSYLIKAAFETLAAPVANNKRPPFYKSLLFTLSLILILSASAQKNEYKLVRTPQNVAVQRTLPANILSYGQAMPANFSKEPTDEEIYRVHFFEEPLVPANVAASPGENQAFVIALASYSQRNSPDSFSSILKFLKDYPKSRWRGALLANLAIVYRRTGYFDNAMNAWKEAWNLLKNQTDPRVKVLADRVISELLLMNAWVGRVDSIEALFKEIDQRVIEGPASPQIVVMRSALWLMKNNPGISFKCGPYALDQIYTSKDSTHSYSEKLMNVQSTSKGFSLSQLEALAKEVGLDYQMAFRQPGSEIIPNAVVHWKLGHYSALLRNDSGNIKCQDATMGTKYGQEFWVTANALDSSSSGYFLVPSGSLPKGWRRVMGSEGDQIFGKGNVPHDPGKHTGPCDAQSECKSCQAQSTPDKSASKPPMAQSNVHLGSVSLHIFDRPVYYTPPVGPSIMFDVDYHQKDTYQPANFSYSNMGPKSTFGWLSYIQDNPHYPSANADLYMMGGGDRTFTGYSFATNSYAPELQSNDVLVRICSSCYELRHPNGSKEVYARPDGNTSNGRKIFLTQIVDVAGNAVTLSYDSLLRITALQDAIGQVTTISYDNSADIYKITKVTDPFGRFASFEYDNNGRLQKITDMIGIVSAFHYNNSDFIDQMTTPYGTTSFISEEGNNSYSAVETHFPLGEKERVEFRQAAPGINFNESIVPTMPAFNQYINYRTTYFWDKKAMQEAPGDYTKAKIYHWLHGSGATNENGVTAPILESTKEPLENRVWYDYQGQYSAGFANQGMSASPSIIGRIMDDGTNQFSKFTYNILGKVTSSIDPIGRKLSYLYDATSIDLLEIRQTTGNANELLAQYTYNSQHLPLTSKDASGQTTTYAYNTKGQVLTITNPKHEITTFVYNANNYLQSVTGPVAGTTINFTYDGFGRAQTITDPEGYTMKVDYDSLSRPTVITYPDSTYEQIIYDRLDAVRSRDRLGRWTQTTYDSLDRPISIQDALGRINQIVWCNCGSIAQIIDPLKHLTTFTHDLQGRDSTKTYDDGKTITYAYEKTTSRLKGVTDAKGQKTQYSYSIDNNLKQITYTNATIATPSVSFTYDPNYNRVATMTDTIGTTVYAYNPVQNQPTLGAGRLASIDGPLANDLIAYTYDSLGRVVGRTINGVSSSVVFDVLGRATSASNALGTFGYTYINQTDRVSSISLPNGLKTILDYFDNHGDQRLKEIWNKSLYGNTQSKFDYEYNAQSQINKWTQQSSGTPPKVYELNYDAADQLTSVGQAANQLPVTIQQYAYKYDSAGNRLMEQTNKNVTLSEYNSLNQLTRQWKGDTVRQVGTIPITPNNTLNNTISYDDNGNTISETSPAVTYEWDAVDRLVKITQGANIIEFVYDGLSRRVAEKLNGIFIKRWLWDGTELAEERDAAGGTAVKRFFPQGEQINGNNYYFSFDHLHSIKEMTDINGVVKVRYDYDPYGRRTKVFGNIDADFGFTGYYYHASSSLYLAMYRAYNPNLGKWLSRDPIGENGGLNQYQFVSNDPINLIDPNGLVVWGQFFQGVFGVVTNLTKAVGSGILALETGGLGVVPALYFATDATIGLERSVFQLMASLEDNPYNRERDNCAIQNMPTGIPTLIADFSNLSDEWKAKAKELEDIISFGKARFALFKIGELKTELKMFIGSQKAVFGMASSLFKLGVDMAEENNKQNGGCKCKK